MTDYLDELAIRLRDGGVDPAWVDSTVADLRSYLTETGADPEAEFGPAAEFAAEFTGGAGAEGADGRPDPGYEEWSWTTDTFSDAELLARHGEQGWEVVRVDRLGRFVCRRDGTDPQRWEYRREWVVGDRARVEARLAPEGWEPCGAWVTYVWFKRPLAASIGPAAGLDAPPPAPGRSNFLSRRYYLLVGAFVVFFIGLGLYNYLGSGDEAEALGYLVGGLVGGAAGGLAVFAYAAWQNRSR